MHASIFVAALAAAVGFVSAEELRQQDVPVACSEMCRPIVELTNICDIDPNAGVVNGSADKESDERVEAECICTNRSFDVAQIMGLCADCMRQNNGNIEDVGKIMMQCSFNSLLFTPSSTALASGIRVDATKPAALEPSLGFRSSASGSARMATSALALSGAGLVFGLA
ncbi:hypothetical protein HIM_05162 [Hirsutella minnesotensis 3608]|uniref:Protein CAP22 n=1 Tax=Hirsutella minnesotensis 3608 TaxID=1043627 RepID=A0A0F7ZKP2_9HYPO|nr:hypothetical protein HIM_05162 [Hirsutella minnesotensis 3608]